MREKSEKQPLKHEIPLEGTNSARRYFYSITKDLNFFFFIINTMMVVDYLPYHAKKALEQIDGKITDDDILKTPAELMEKEPGRSVKKLRGHSQEFIEMILSRIVDSFQVYIVDLVREILHVKPEILINNQPTISIAQLLKANSMELLIQEAVESKVTTLANKGFGNIEEWCLTNGIPITVKPESKANIIEFIAIRNIIVHNRCIVDEKFLKAVPTSEFQLGRPRELDVNDLYLALSTLNEIVFNTDQKSIQKSIFKQQKYVRISKKPNFNFA